MCLFLRVPFLGGFKWKPKEKHPPFHGSPKKRRGTPLPEDAGLEKDVTFLAKDMEVKLGQVFNNLKVVKVNLKNKWVEAGAEGRGRKPLEVRIKTRVDEG